MLSMYAEFNTANELEKKGFCRYFRDKKKK